MSLLSQPHVDALARGELACQVCERCGTAQRLARFACTRCGHTGLAWKTATGTGTVWAVTVVERPPAPEFASLVPYALVLVDLDEGARVMGHAPLGTRIGERVRAEVFTPGARPLLRFRARSGG
ncbi:MAG TPA: OB-fold domain-containing protein [Burkholderiaceae bacterium]|nr:OB-fold domain-containing protein [Burkholderiaceae bacterium]